MIPLHLPIQKKSLSTITSIVKKRKYLDGEATVGPRIVCISPAMLVPRCRHNFVGLSAACVSPVKQISTSEFDGTRRIDRILYLSMKPFYGTVPGTTNSVAGY